MKMKNTIFIGGAHRGGRAITDSALRWLPKTTVIDELAIADPKKDRASQLAKIWRDKGFRAIGLKETCEDAVIRFHPDFIVLSIDKIQPMAEILGKEPQPTQWQLLARGLGTNGPVVGLAGTVSAGKSNARVSSVRLINELSSFITPRSSINIRENLLNADILYSMRKRISEHSVKRLKVLDRDSRNINGGALNFFWGMKIYPLMVQEKSIEQKWKETKQQALEVELPQELKDDKEFTVATVGQKTIDFFIIESIRGHRITKFNMTLIHTLPMSVSSPLVKAAPAVVTD